MQNPRMQKSCKKRAKRVCLHVVLHSWVLQAAPPAIVSHLWGVLFCILVVVQLARPQQCTQKIRPDCLQVPRVHSRGHSEGPRTGPNRPKSVDCRGARGCCCKSAGPHRDGSNIQQTKYYKILKNRSWRTLQGPPVFFVNLLFSISSVSFPAKVLHERFVH